MKGNTEKKANFRNSNNKTAYTKINVDKLKQTRENTYIGKNSYVHEKNSYTCIIYMI